MAVKLGMRLRVKDYAYCHCTDFDHDQRRNTKDFDKISGLCVARVTEALKKPSAPYTEMHCNQIGDIFRSMLVTQRGIRRMLDFEGPIEPETVDALLLARIQLESLFSVCLMLEDPKYTVEYVQDHWRKQYVVYLLAKEETKHLARYQPLLIPELQRLITLGQEFNIDPAHLHTVDKEELGVPMPPGMAERPIRPFPTPGKAIKNMKSSLEKKHMLERLYAEYVYLCSFAHALPEANLLKNMFDSRSQARKIIPDSKVMSSYQKLASDAYITSFMSIAQSTAEFTARYPNNMEIIEAAHLAWHQLSGASTVTKAVWEIRTKRLLGALA